MFFLYYGQHKQPNSTPVCICHSVQYRLLNIWDYLSNSSTTNSVLTLKRLVTVECRTHHEIINNSCELTLLVTSIAVSGYIVLGMEESRVD